MMPFLADEMPPLNNFWTLLPLLFTAIMAIGTWGLYWNSRRQPKVDINNQPLQVELAKRFADKTEFDNAVAENKRQHDEFTDRFRQLESDSIRSVQKMSEEWRNWAEEKFTDLLKSNERGRGELHEKINGAREELSALDATTTIQNQQLASIQADIKRILERRLN